MRQDCRQKRNADRRDARTANGLPPPAAVTPFPVPACLALAVAAIVALTYRPVLSAGAVSFDDECYLTDNPIIENPGWHSVRRAFGEVLRPYVPGYYEPLAVVSLMLDYAQGGRMGHLRPFHRTSLALHVVNTVLVIALLHGLLRQPWPAALAGLLFGVHPLTVEPVALVAQRKVLLAAMFSLACLVFYVQYVRADGRRVRWLLFAAAVATYGLALLSKPTSTPLPVLMLLLDFWPLRRLGRRAVWEKVPFFMLGAASGAITLLSCGNTSGVAWPAARLPLTIAYLVAFYFSKMAWPAGLSSVYPLPTPFGLSNTAVLIGVLAACGLAAATVLSLRRTRAVVVGVLFFLAAILPTMGVVGYTWVTAGDKHVYPSVAYFDRLTRRIVGFAGCGGGRATDVGARHLH